MEANNYDLYILEDLPDEMQSDVEILLQAVNSHHVIKI